MLRRFFSAAAVAFLLALAVHLGHETAQAQSPGQRIVGDNLIVSGGALYLLDARGWEPQSGLPIPADGIASAYEPGAGQLLDVISTTGDGWSRDGAGAPWVNYGPAPGAQPTNVAHSSWGAVKNRYR